MLLVFDTGERPRKFLGRNRSFTVRVWHLYWKTGWVAPVSIVLLAWFTRRVTGIFQRNSQILHRVVRNRCDIIFVIFALCQKWNWNTDSYSLYGMCLQQQVDRKALFDMGQLEIIGSMISQWNGTHSILTCWISKSHWNY